MRKALSVAVLFIDNVRREYDILQLYRFIDGQAEREKIMAVV